MLDYRIHTTYYLILSLLLMCLWGSSSCGSDSNKANLLDPNVKYRSDTMFAHKRMAIIKELDSLCLLKEDEYIAEAVDSLLPIAQKQIDAILNRTSN